MNWLIALLSLFAIAYFAVRRLRGGPSCGGGGGCGCGGHGQGHDHGEVGCACGGSRTCACGGEKPEGPLDEPAE